MYQWAKQTKSLLRSQTLLCWGFYFLAVMKTSVENGFKHQWKCLTAQVEQNGWGLIRNRLCGLNPPSFPYLNSLDKINSHSGLLLGREIRARFWSCSGLHFIWKGEQPGLKVWAGGSARAWGFWGGQEGVLTYDIMQRVSEIEHMKTPSQCFLNLICRVKHSVYRLERKLASWEK